MHDIRRIREAPEAFDAALARRGMAPQAAGLVALDAERRTAIAESERLRAEQNRIAKLIGQAKAKGEDAGALLTEAATLKAGEGNQAAQATEIGGRLDAALSNLPNLLDPDVPDGADETANRVLHQHGTPAPLGFPARQHFEIGETGRGGEARCDHGAAVPPAATRVRKASTTVGSKRLPANAAISATASAGARAGR